MKKGILCILLSVIMLLPVLTSCQQEADFTEKAASVYTLYTIVDESTTKEDIINVELALNRIIYYRLNMILKLEAVTEAEYDDLSPKRPKRQARTVSTARQTAALSLGQTGSRRSRKKN